MFNIKYAKSCQFLYYVNVCFHYRKPPLLFIILLYHKYIGKSIQFVDSIKICIPQHITINSTNIKTWISDLSYASTAVNSVKQATTTTAYANAVKNLSLRQAELALSTKALTAEQQREILVTAGLIKETGTLTMAQATEALTTDTRNAADVEALMLKAGLITELGAETTATITVDAAKLKELVDTKVLTQAEAELLAMKAGVTLQSTKEAATLIASNAKLGSSFAIMGKTAGAALKGIGTGLLSFASAHPLIASLVGVVSIVGLVTTGTKKLREEQEQAIETARSLQEEYRSSTKSLSDNISSLESQKDEFERLSKGVDDYGKNISLSSDEYDRYKSIVSEILGYSPELIQGYDAEGNAIANKNSLIERSIELMKEEQRQKLKEMTTDEKTKTAYEGAKADWEQTKGYEGANTRNDIARWFNDNAMSGGWNYEVDIAEILGIKDEWKEEGNNLQNAIINNIETVAKNIKEKKAELLALKDENGNALFTEAEIDAMIDQADTWQQQYADWQRDIEDAKHGMDDQFELYAQKADGYNDLTDAQKAFVNEYIKATGDIIDADGNLLSEDEIIKKAEGYTKFVEKLANDPNFEEARTKINTLFSLDKSQMSASEYEKQVNAILKELQDKFNLTDDEVMDFKIALGFTFTSDGKTQTGELLDQVKGKLKDEFDGKADELTLEELQIAAKIVADIPEGTLLSWDELQDKIKETQGNANKMTDSLKSLNESLDKIQSAYQAVESAIEEYNKEGYLSVDTFQSLIGLEPKYLNMLLDENGNLNLNTDTVNENTRAYLQNLGIKSAEAMLDTLTTYSSEAQQLDYLSGALNTNTQETWANVYAKLEQLKVDGKITDAVYNSAHARLDAYKKMTDDAIAGIGKGGLGKSASDTSDKIKDTKKQLDDLAKTEALDALKYKFDQLEQSIEKVDNAMSLLDTSLDLQAENDYVGKLETVTRQLDLAQQKSALLRDEFTQLSNTQYNTADEANELATRMKSVADSIADNSKNIIEYGKSITEYYMSAMSSIGSMADASIERATSLFERNVKTLQEGGLTGLQFNLSPIVPQSAFEKQRQENRNMEDEMRSYYDTVADMQKTALDMQYQETVADNERKRQELLGSLNEAMSAQQSYSIGTQSLQKSTNNATSQEQVQDDKEKLAEQESFISSMKDNIVGLNNWMIENPIKAPKLDGSWQQRVEEAQRYAQRIKDTLSGSDNTSGTDETTNTGEGLVETAKKYLGTPYKWGGTSPTTGFDCSGLMYYVYKENGKSIPRTSQEQYKGGTAVDKSALSEEDLVFFSTDGSGTATHVGMYVGDNKFIHAPRTGDVVKYSDLNSKYYKEHYLGARRYAKGTKDFAVYGDNINGVAGEHYKPEILINKKTGEMITIDEPTFVDTGKYDVVGEKTTAKALPQYANGTLGNMNMSSELPKLSVEQIQKVLSTNFKNSRLNVAGAAEGIFNAQQSTGISALAMLSIAAGESTWGTSELAIAKNNYWGWNHYPANGKSAFERATTFSSNPGEAFKAYGEKLISAGYSEQSLAKMADRYCPGGKWYGLVSGTMSSIVNTLNDAGLGDMSANIATTASNTASITSNVSSIRHSFDSQLQEWINGGDSTSTSSTTEDELLAYIKENIKLSEYGNEEFIKKWDAFQAINEKGNIKFKALDEFLLKSVGTGNYNATKDSVVKEINDYTNAIMEASAEANLAELKRQYDINKDIANKMLAFYNYKKAEGATADVLTTIINFYNKQLEKVNDISDEWVSTMQSLTDYLMSQDATKLQAHDDRLSWIEKENEEFTRQYENTDENDFASKTALAERIVDRHNQIISENVKKQNTAHQNVLDLYNNEDYMPIFERYDVEAWFDASGEATAKYNEELAALSATNSELATVMAQVFAIIQQNRKAFYEAAEAIQSADESLIDFNKNRKLENVDVYIKYQERLVEALDFDASISQSLSTAKEGMYNIFKTLRDEKAEMDKELKANMQIDDWLTEDTRKLLFNLDDYEEQMETINGIQAEAEKLYINYKNELEGLKEDELYKEEEITAEYNRQLEKLQDKLSVAKADLQLAKDKAAFENTRKERDTQIIMGNGVRNVADPERLREAAMKMAESESALGNEVTTSAENQDIRNMEIATGMINQEKAAIQNRIDMINDMTSAEREALAGYIEPIEIIGAKLNAISKTNPERIINGDNSNKVLSGLDLTKRDGWSLTGDHSEMVEMFSNLLENGYYKKNTFEYDVVSNLVEWIKWQHDNETTSDAYNYGYSLYNADNAYLWGKGAMKIYSDDAFRVMSQPAVPIDEYINDIINSRIDEEKLNVVVSGGINVVTNNPQSTYPSFLQGYEELDGVSMFQQTLGVDEDAASAIFERFEVGNIAPTIDTFVTLAEMAKVWGNASDTRGNTDNSVHMENVNITLEKPVTNPNDFVQQFINKVYSEYSTTNNQR